MGSSHRLLAAVRRRTRIEKPLRRVPVSIICGRRAAVRIVAVTVSPKTRHETPEAGKRRRREAVPRLDSRAKRALCYPCRPGRDVRDLSLSFRWRHERRNDSPLVVARWQANLAAYQRPPPIESPLDSPTCNQLVGAQAILSQGHFGLIVRALAA